MSEANLRSFSKRLEQLAGHLRPGAGPCPLVVEGEAATRVVLTHFDGGPDAQYVSVSLEAEHAVPRTITLGYDAIVEGTAIVYDVTGETMQGKARPFACELWAGRPRLFALLPFQIEGVAVRVEGGGSDRPMSITFVEGRGEVIRAAVPFELRLMTRFTREAQRQFLATDPRGKCIVKLPSVERTQKATIRSLLTGYSHEVAWD
jgi:hypothetical protein